MRCICVIGPTGAGKTTYCGKIHEHGGVPALFLGKLCRSKFGEASMARAENPVTPDISEQFVRSSVSEFIQFQKAKNIESVIIDGFPRNPGQVDFLFRLCGELGICLRVLHIFASMSLRVDRIRARDKDNASKMALSCRRLIEEYDQLEDVQSALIRLGIYPRHMRND